MPTPLQQKVEKLKVDNFHVGRYLRELIVDSGELADNIVSDVAEIVLKEELRKKGYTTGLTEDDKLAILTADNTKPQDDKKTRNLSNEEIVKGIMVAKKLVKQSNADPDPNKKPVLPIQKPGEKPEGTGFVHPKAKQNLEDVSKINITESVLGK